MTTADPIHHIRRRDAQDYAGHSPEQMRADVRYLLAELGRMRAAAGAGEVVRVAVPADRVLGAQGAIDMLTAWGAL